MKEIAKRLDVSPASVHLWTRDVEISPEHRERNMERSRTAFSVTWAELHRRRRLEAQLAHMTVFFARFVRECFGTKVDDFSLRLNVYLGNGLSLEEIEDHWLLHLGLPQTCLRRHIVDHFPTSSSGRKRNLPYGVCTLTVRRSTHLVQHIYGAIQEYAGFEEPRWLDGPPTKSQAGRKRSAASADQ